MIHAPLYPREEPLQIPPLAGARLYSPSGPDTGEAGHPAGVSSLLSPPGNHSTEPPAAWTAVLDERRRQIAKFGHTPESDAALPLKQLPREAARFLTAAIEDVQYQRDAWRNHARRHLIRAAAMILAAMDRIEAEPADEDPFIQSLSKDPL